MLVLLLFGSFFSAKSEVYITKHGWGLFKTWYNYVEQNNDPNDYVVICSQPRFTRCRPIGLAVFPGNPTVLTDSNYDAIEAYIRTSLTETNTSGTFIYNSEYYIIYNYNLATDIQTTRILSIQEAQTLNYI
jgi:hypothetical protein